MEQLFSRSRWIKGGLGAGFVLAILALVAASWHDRTPVMAAAADVPAVASAPMVGSYANLVDRVAPAVVTVRSTREMHQTQLPFDDDLFRRFFGRDGMGPQMPEGPRRQAGLGSGVIVTQDGFILTNHHVVDSAEKVRVDLADGRSFEAQVVGTDRPSDLAVLKIPARNLTTLPLGDSDQARVGDVVLAIGNPLGIGQTVTMGIISAKGRATGASEGAFEDFIQTDAPINQGNSGGALVNTRGELVGINSQILSPVGYNIGIGFAIPASMARNVMDQLVESGTVRRGMLGVTVQGVDANLARGLGLDRIGGAIVTDVSDGSPAAAAGLRQGDVIIALNGESIDSSNALRNEVARLEPGSSVTLTVIRDGKEQALTATLAELPTSAARTADASAPTASGRYGMTVQPLTQEMARRAGLDVGTGLFVAEVDPSGAAAEAGIQRGDVILQANGQEVTSAAALRTALETASADKPSLLLVHRRGANLFLTLEGTRS
jgi:Do/DeqQ family serine protease